MAYTLRMDICQRAEELVDVYLDLKNGHSGLHLIEKARGAVHGLRDKLQNQIEVDFIFLD